MSDKLNSTSNQIQSDVPKDIPAEPFQQQASVFSQTSQTTTLSQPPKHEDFVYKPRPRINLKKTSKMLFSILSLIVIAIPLVFIYFKFFSAPKNESGVKKGEIVWWNIGGNEIVLKKLVGDYISQNPGVKITFVQQSEIEYGPRLINSLKDGKGPDVFTIHNSWTPMLIDHMDIIPPDVYSKDDYVKDFYPVVVSDFSTSKGIVAIPSEYDALTLFINDDIFSRSASIYPVTWDEFIETAENLATRDGKNMILQSGASMGITENVDFWQETVALLVLQNKSGLFAPGGTRAFEALRTYADFARVQKTWNNTLPNSITAFAEGKVAMMFAPTRAVNEIKSINPSLKFRTVLTPQVRKDDPMEPDVSYASYWARGVWNKSNDKELAWNFLKYLSQDDSYETMSVYYKDLGLVPPPLPKTSYVEKLINDRYLGSVIALAPFASSWYLADRTYDGEEGINSVVNTAYKDVVDSLSKKSGSNSTKILKDLSSQIKSGLFPYGIYK